VSNRIATIVILAEDRRQANFARRWLKRRGHDSRSFRTNICPRGSGEQFVREQYPGELIEQRRRAARHKSALVVLIDADTGPVVQRHRQLDDVAGRAHGESVAVLVPKRNIETWLLFLCGEEVVESVDYKNRTLPTRAEASAAEQFEAWVDTPPANWLPSLHDAATEARRIPRVTS
jgi:hypothetical protein